MTACERRDDRELLAKLTPRTVQMGTVGRSQVRPENLAYLLSGLRRGPLYLVQWLDLGEDAGRTRLYEELRAVLPRMPAVKVWYGDGAALEKLIVLAMHEVSRHNRCSMCDGRRNVMSDAGPKECSRCLGSGYSGLSGHERAAFLGVAESTWRVVWRPKYRDVLSVLAAYESTIASHIRKRLGRGA